MYPVVADTEVDLLELIKDAKTSRFDIADATRVILR